MELEADKVRLMAADQEEKPRPPWSIRLKRRVNELGWDLKTLHENSGGLSYDQVNKALRGEVENPRGSAMAKLAKAVGVSEPWLRYGIKGDNSVTYGGASDMVNLRRVPIISFVEAGKLTDVSNAYEVGDGEEFIACDPGVGPRSFALRVSGESMLPRFKPGEVIVCDPDAPVKPGDFVIAKTATSEEATFKKYRPRQITPAGIELFDLVPLNDDYPVISADETNPIHLIGKVVKRWETL